MSTKEPLAIIQTPLEEKAYEAALALPAQLSAEVNNLLKDVGLAKMTKASRVIMVGRIATISRLVLNDIAGAQGRAQSAANTLTGIVDTLAAAGHKGADAANLQQVVETILQRLAAYHTALEANAGERQKMNEEVRTLQQTVLSMSIELHGPEKTEPRAMTGRGPSA